MALRRVAAAPAAAAALWIAASACTPRAASSGAGASARSTARPDAAPADGATNADAGAPAGAPADGATDAGPAASADGATSPDAANAHTDDGEPAPAFDAISEILFADRASRASARAACPESVPADARVRCLYDRRYAGDSKASSLAQELLATFHIVAGVDAAHTMDGGYRGMLRLVPAVPTGQDRKHLEWTVAAFRDFDRFFRELDAYGKDHGAGPPSKTYRFRGIALRFVRSVNANRPSAYAHDWTIGYNLRGSINLNADMVRETLFHEIFHLNDPVHGGAGARWWSEGALSGIYDAVVKKCGTKTACLAPYTPNGTMVRGGTYYAFQPGNGVVEYAAELALRYYREQRAALRHLRLPAGAKAFKCGPPENARAWELMKNDFFRALDATPPC